MFPKTVNSMEYYVNILDVGDADAIVINYSSFGFRLWGWFYCIKKALSFSVYHGKWVTQVSD